MILHTKFAGKLGVILTLLCGASACTPFSNTFDPNKVYEDSTEFLALPPLAPKHLVASYSLFQSERKTTRAFTTDLLGRPLAVAAGESVRIIRKLSYNSIPSYVVMHAESFALGLFKQVDIDAGSVDASQEAIKATSLFKALGGTRTKTVSGLNEFLPALPGNSKVRFAVTIDMCQSSNPWDQDLFNRLVALGGELGKPVHVGVAMTGLWAAGHAENFHQLVRWQKEGKLDITWINHSYRHTLSKQSSGEFLFLTAPTINFKAEVLDLEKLLLEQGLMFSPLFRFPGLAHNAARLTELNSLSLFGLDANAWLAKGEKIEDRSVVLIHGNGNERNGIELFLKEIKSRREKLATGIEKILTPLFAVPLLRR